MNCMFTAQGDYICVNDKGTSKSKQSRPLLERFIVDNLPNESSSCANQIISCKAMCPLLTQPNRDMLSDDIKSTLLKCEGICKEIMKK